jgi:hypothetical protein
LPDFYVAEYKRQLGKYSELMPIEESQPVLDNEAVRPLVTHTASQSRGPVASLHRDSAAVPALYQEGLAL